LALTSILLKLQKNGVVLAKLALPIKASLKTLAILNMSQVIEKLTVIPSEPLPRQGAPGRQNPASKD
jgi:hypothetical protein